LSAVRTPPQDIDTKMLAGLVTAHWAVRVQRLDYAPVGAGGHHWWATTPAGDLFVTVDDLTARSHADGGGIDVAFSRLAGALGTARQLDDDGLEFVAAPLVDMDGSAVVRWRGKLVVSVTPRVDGVQHGWGSFEPHERDEVLRLLVRLHAAHPTRPPERDDFLLQGRAALTRAITSREHEWTGGPFGEAARQLLLGRYDDVVEALRRYGESVRAAAAQQHRFVVTHGEPHRGNVIATANGPMLVDWDTCRLAPPERDLWWFRDSPDALAAYESSASFVADTAMLELYRLRWTLTDLALYTDELRGAHLDDDDSELAWNALMECYATL
jgi:hypothetical protein